MKRTLSFIPDSMKTTTLVTLLALGLVGCTTFPGNTRFGASQTNTPASESGCAEVQRLRGTAQFCTNGSDWVTLQKGMRLGPGTVVQTSAKSTVSLSLGDDIGGVRVKPDSRLGFEDMLRSGNRRKGGYKIHLNLMRGGIAMHADWMSETSVFEVKLSHGVAGLRCGGDYTVYADGLVSATAGGIVVALLGADGRVVTCVVEASSFPWFSHHNPFNDRGR